MRQIFMAAFLLLGAVTAFAQHTIRGKVYDEKGNALAGATIQVENTTLRKATGKDGSFAFDKLTNTSYQLKISYMGYETLTLHTETERELVLKLQPLSVSINEITVTSLRANDKSPLAYSNIGKESLSKSNLGQDLPYLISNTPSLVITSDAGTGIGYTNFRIRGTDASRINVTINGIPYNDADEQGTYWVDVPDFTSSVENIQVQRGVGTSTNGAAAFGANINIQTDYHAPKASGEISASYGSFNSRKTTVKASSGLLNGHWAIDTRLSSISSDGFIDRAFTKMKSYFVQAGYYGEKTTVKFITFGGTEKTYHAWDGVDSYELPKLEYARTYNPCGYMGDDANGNPLYYKNQTDNYVQTNYQLLAAHSINPFLTLNAGLHYTRGDGYYEEYKKNNPWSPVNLVEYSLDSFKVDNIYITQTDLVRQKWMGNDFAGGIFSLNYQKRKLNAQLGGAVNNYWGNHWGEVTWVKNYVGDLLPGTEYYRSRVSKFDGNIYLKANYEITAKLNIFGDLQYRRVNYNLHGTNDQWVDDAVGMQGLNIDKVFNFFNPKAGVFYSPGEFSDMFLSFAVANREPTRTNYTDGTPGVWPTHETLYDTELGYKYHTGNFSAGANAYMMYYRNQLVLTGKINDIGELLTENIPVSYRSGIELMTGVKLTDFLRWDVNATLSYNRIADFTETVNVIDENWLPTGQSVDFHYQNTPIAFSPELLANSMITFNKGNFEAGFQSVYVGNQYVDNTGKADRRLPAYFVNNLRLKYDVPAKFVSGLSFTLLVNNLFNEKYISSAWSSPSISDNKDNPVYNQQSTVYNYFGCYPQAGVNVLGGVTVRF
ncbi:MAG TPA: TonB-dependent receptor [Paludibacter sp.]|nr:TonB-dependent receptor [Paludibacter sp.]